MIIVGFNASAARQFVQDLKWALDGLSLKEPARFVKVQGDPGLTIIFRVDESEPKIEMRDAKP